MDTSPKALIYPHALGSLILWVTLVEGLMHIDNLTVVAIIQHES